MVLPSGDLEVGEFFRGPSSCSHSARHPQFSARLTAEADLPRGLISSPDGDSELALTRALAQPREMGAAIVLVSPAPSWYRAWTRPCG